MVVWSAILYTCGEFDIEGLPRASEVLHWTKAGAIDEVEKWIKDLLPMFHPTLKWTRITPHLYAADLDLMDWVAALRCQALPAGYPQFESHHAAIGLF